ncbi:amiloride-sensitive amine oxidase [copper-containing]-like [Mytilus trossulus]|uniref:amiloride-sensitive amine oxidase [copper-containing]-like n=1 Tax=Mytilus trossulus TaxID=6551 RepID=UPI0030057B23
MSSKEKKKASRQDKKLLWIRIGFLTVTFIALFLLSCVVILSVYQIRGKLYVCDLGYPVNPRDKNKPGVFDSLTLKEYESVTKYLFKKTNLSLVAFNEAFPNCSYIYMIDLLLPLKDAVLEHLDLGTRQPERTAHVVIVRGDRSVRRVEEYHVGPLHRLSYHIKVTNPSYTKSNIPYNFKPVDDVEYKFLYRILRETSEVLYPLLYESYGLSYHNCTKNVDCIIFHDISPRGIREGERQSWFGAYRDVEGFYLHPLGLEMQLDHSSRDVRQWYVYRIVYNGHFAYSPENLMERYTQGSIEKITLPFYEEKDTSYSSLWRRGNREMERPLQGPKLVEPDGHRYRVDGLHLTYMKWNMNMKMRSSSGLQIFDIRFNDERIIYELSFQEVAIFYSGYGPLADLVNTYGNSYMLGATSSELIPGVDCPETSTFLDSDHFVNSEKPFRAKNTICIFEDHANIPIRRHSSKDASGKFQSYGGLGNYKLIIRSISTIWNYDYIFDYIFYLNGALETKVSLSGYLHSAFPLYHEMRHGTLVHTNVVANIHQHLFHFKIDIDINGRINRYETVDFRTENTTRQWYSNARKQQMTYETKTRLTEYDANYKTKPGNQYDIIYNQYASSKFGSARSYRIVNNNKANFLLKDSDITQGASWAKFPLAISQFQETEVMSTSIYNGNGPWYPVVDFERFLQNNDTIRDRDLITWITMGLDKIPHTEDVPTISTVGSQVSFYLLPFNFFTECPSISSNSAVHISTDKDRNKVNVNTFGTPLTSSCIQKENKPSNFDGKTKPID